MLLLIQVRAQIAILNFEGHYMHNNALILWGSKAKSKGTEAMASMALVYLGPDTGTKKVRKGNKGPFLANVYKRYHCSHHLWERVTVPLECFGVTMQIAIAMYRMR